MSLESSTPKPASTAIQWLRGKIAYSVGFGVVFLLAIGAGLFYLNSRKPPVQVVRIAYGAGAAGRKRFLDELAAEGRKRHLDIQLVATADTDQTLTMVDQHEVDMGLIAGVVQDRGSRRVLEVTPLYMEPLQLLVKAELYDAVLKDFGALKGKSINLDTENSANHLLAGELLRFMGMNDEATGKPLYQPVFIPQAKLSDRQPGGFQADAIFQIGGVPSTTIRNQIVHNNYRIVPLPFGSSFNLNKFQEAESPDASATSNLRLDKSFVEEAVIPEFAYSVLPAVPPSDTRTIATRLVLVGSDRLNVHVVHSVLDLIFSPEVKGFSTPALTTALLDMNFQFDRHPGTDAYLKSLQPVDVEGAFTTYGRLVEVWGIIITLYIGAAKGLKAWQHRKLHDRRSVGDFMQDVIEIEDQAGADCSPAKRIQLDQRLTDLKKAALKLHFEEILDDAEELPHLLVMLADTRTRIWGPAS